jgi:hypothetical protein
VFPLARGTTWDASAAICRVLARLTSIRVPLAIALLLTQSLAKADGWQPSPGHVQVPIWPGAVPDAIPNPKPESVGPPLACTMHDGTDFHGHAGKFGNVGA